MEVYFKNDGSYNSSAVYTPIIAIGRPIGFIQSVTEGNVICQIFDGYVSKEFLEGSKLASICIDIKNWGFENS